MGKVVRGWGRKKSSITVWVGEVTFDRKQYPITAVNQTNNDLRFRCFTHLIAFPSYSVYTRILLTIKPTIKIYVTFIGLLIIIKLLQKTEPLKI